jgi:hypothetical protein
VYYYRLSAENRCGTTAAQSAILNSMELLATADNGVWHISWNSLFLGRSYSLSRLEPAPQHLLATAADTAYADRIDPSHAALRYCYRVEAVTDDGAESTAAACADYTPEVLMPDATDPKSTVQNPRSGRQRNQFGPVLFIDPSLYAYRLEIYNRHGARIAAVEKTAADAPEDKSWNGTDAAGGFVPEDMYLYRVELTFVNGESAVKTGNVAVIYGLTD